MDTTGATRCGVPILYRVTELRFELPSLLTPEVTAIISNFTSLQIIVISEYVVELPPADAGDPDFVMTLQKQFPKAKIEYHPIKRG